MKMYDCNQKARPSPSPIAFKLAMNKRKNLKNEQSKLLTTGD